MPLTFPTPRAPALRLVLVLACSVPSGLAGQRPQPPAPPAPDDTLATVRVVSRDALGALPLDELDELLLLIPGLAEPGQGGGPLIRGGGPDEWAVWLDGVPLRTGRGRAFTFGVPPNALGRLAVHTGPLPPSLGDAQGGVVALRTRRGAARWRGGLAYETDNLFGRGTSLGLNRFEGEIGGPLAGRLSFFAAGTLQGRAADPYGPGVGDAGAFVAVGVDTTVTETLSDGSTREVDVRRFARYTGACDPQDNAGAACHGRSLPYDWSTALALTGALAWRYEDRGSLDLTVLRHEAQDRFWPGPFTFNPATYAGARTTGTAVVLGWTHGLGAGARAPVLHVAGSRQTATTVTGLLDPAWELAHRDPAAGIVLAPMTFLVSPERFSADTGAGAVRRLSSDEDWTRLVDNVVTNAGTRVPYLDRNDLRLAQPYRMNPWASATGFPTVGLEGSGPPRTALASEAYWIGRAVLTWPVAGSYRIRAGADYADARVRAFVGRLLRQSDLAVFAERPRQLGAFAEARVAAGPVVLDGGLRWDTFDPRAVFPVVPGRLFTHPRFDPADPYDPADSVFAPAASQSALSPRVRLALDVPGPLTLRVGYAEQARHPDLSAMFTGKNRDVAFSSTTEPFGGPLDWERSRHLEAGLRVAVAPGLAADAVVFHVQKVADAAIGLETFFDPVGGRDQAFLVPTLADTGAVTGVELALAGQPAAWLDLQVAYSLADARGTLAAVANRKHTLAGWVVARWPADGPADSWVARVLRGGEAAARFRLSSGLPYLPLVNQGFGTLVPPEAFGTARGERVDLPGVKEIDLRVGRGFRSVGVRWGVFAEVRNLFGWRNTYRLFAETDSLANDLHRALVLDPELARLQAEAGSRWIQVTNGGRTLFAADLTGDCATWDGGAVNCVLLRRAEARFGNGDGFYDEDEARSALGAMYDLLFGQWTLLGPPRHARVGLEVRF